ncbi:MAG: class I SAM-dependent methyltransferase [Nitrospirota bacterium]|nr:class I SAM-dependent methyltransferase [Nitrospirota bacterium]
MNRVGRLAAKYREDRLRKLLRDKTEYVFTTDYVSSMTPVWRKYAEAFRGKENVKLLEIGSYEGRSCIWFLENILTHPTSSITCVDIFPPEPELVFDHNIRISGLRDKVTKMKGTSESTLPNLREKSFDIIYVDGCHIAANVLMDAVASWLLLKPGGIMIFDDYEWEPHKRTEYRPKIAIDLFLKVFQNHIGVLHKGYQVIISKSMEAAELENFPEHG